MDTKTLEAKYRVAIIISLIIGASIFGYGYMDYSYKKEALNQKIKSEENAKLAERQAEVQKEQKYEKCKNTAWEMFNSDWNNACEGQGLEIDCQLPSNSADKLNKRRTDDIDTCYKVIYQK